MTMHNTNETENIAILPIDHTVHEFFMSTANSLGISVSIKNGLYNCEFDNPADLFYLGRTIAFAPDNFFTGKPGLPLKKKEINDFVKKDRNPVKPADNDSIF